jgi:hypothetical protein
MKKVLAATLLIGSLTTTSAFAKENEHEKEFKHHKQHEVKKVKTPVQTTTTPMPVQSPTTPATTQTPVQITTLTNPITGFSTLTSIAGGYDTSVRLVSVMWAKGLAYEYSIYVDGVKVKTVLDSQGLTFMQYQQVMSVGVHTIGISVIDQNGNESQQCVKTVSVQ